MLSGTAFVGNSAVEGGIFTLAEKKTARLEFFSCTQILLLPPPSQSRSEGILCHLSACLLSEFPLRALVCIGIPGSRDPCHPTSFYTPKPGSGMNPLYLREAHHFSYGRPWSLGRDIFQQMLKSGLEPKHVLLDYGMVCACDMCAERVVCVAMTIPEGLLDGSGFCLTRSASATNHDCAMGFHAVSAGVVGMYVDLTRSSHQCTLSRVHNIINSHSCPQLFVGSPSALRPMPTCAYCLTRVYPAWSCDLRAHCATVYT